MKNLLKSLFAIVFLAIASNQVKSQVYKTGLGLSVDFGDGSTMVGPVVKYFFDQKNAAQSEVVFANHFTKLQIMYSYNQKVSGSRGLGWYLGGGPSLGFPKYRDTQFFIVPMAGLEYKVNATPITFSFDWRPNISLSSGSGDATVVGRFGFGAKYIF